VGVCQRAAVGGIKTEGYLNRSVVRGGERSFCRDGGGGGEAVGGVIPRPTGPKRKDTDRAKWMLGGDLLYETSGVLKGGSLSLPKSQLRTLHHKCKKVGLERSNHGPKKKILNYKKNLKALVKAKAGAKKEGGRRACRKERVSEEKKILLNLQEEAMRRRHHQARKRGK